MNPQRALTAWLERHWYAGVPPGLLARLLERAYVAGRARMEARARACNAAVPVVVIGNIVLGGTGKTPTLIALGKALLAEGLRIGVISRGHGALSRSSVPLRVLAGSDPLRCGDEPVLLAARLGCPVWVGRDRVAALRALLADTPVDVVLSDDGLQHTALGRSLEICMIDGERGLGNGHCLPAGPLREPAERLARVDFVLAKGVPRSHLPGVDGVMHLRPVEWRNVASDAAVPLWHFPQGTRVRAIAGIAHPGQFFTLLRRLGLEVVEQALPDHHRFSARDFVGISERVVMTEKDAVKCRRTAPPGALALRIDADLPAELLLLLRHRLALPAR